MPIFQKAARFDPIHTVVPEYTETSISNLETIGYRIKKAPETHSDIERLLKPEDNFVGGYVVLCFKS